MAKHVFDLKSLIGSNTAVHTTLEIDPVSRTIEIRQNGQLHCADGPALIRSNGELQWYFGGLLHRSDGPAIERPDGSKDWFLHGQLHRADGPAIECATGSKSWYEFGKKHRIGGPAQEWSTGTREWWVDGKRHRDDGPAYEAPVYDNLDGESRLIGWEKQYWLNGVLHRDDGPAVEQADGHLEYWRHGVELKRKPRRLTPSPR